MTGRDPLRHYRQVWLVDFEFHQPPGERPSAVCMVATEYRSKRTLRIWREDLICMVDPPFLTDETCLFVAYYASAELSCFLTLDW